MSGKIFKRSGFVLIFWTLIFWVFSLSVQADIYRYVDVYGRVYFTNVPLDSRWELYLRTPKRESPFRFKGKDLFEEIARKYGLDPALLKAVARVESDFNPRAVSPKGALGLMQLMPETARIVGVKDPFDPRENLEGAARFLKGLLMEFGDLRKALAAYNAGPEAVRRYGGVPPYPETLSYVNRVLEYLDRYRR